MKSLRHMSYIAVVILTIVLISHREASAQATDAKLWSGFTGQIDLLEPLRLNVEHQQRMGADIGFEKSITDFELRFDATDLIRVGASYRTIATYDDGFWHRGSLNLGLGHEFGRLGASYLLRLQATARSNETVTNLRNKVKLQYDTDTTITPSASFELHYSTTNSEFREVRLRLGADKKLNKKLTIDVSYMWQSEFNKQVSESNHVVRLGLTYVFRKIKKRDKLEASGS